NKAFLYGKYEDILRFVYQSLSISFVENALWASLGDHEEFPHRCVVKDASNDMKYVKDVHVPSISCGFSLDLNASCDACNLFGALITQSIPFYKGNNDKDAANDVMDQGNSKESKDGLIEDDKEYYVVESDLFLEHIFKVPNGE
ncbi:hypothetical protein GOP47_0028051, partial [Adiantum capillus-veneris]